MFDAWEGIDAAVRSAQMITNPSKLLHASRSMLLGRCACIQSIHSSLDRWISWIGTLNE